MILLLNIYGFRLEVSGPPGVLNKLGKDFSYFTSLKKKRGEEYFSIFLYEKNAGREIIPTGKKVSYYHPEFVQYESGSVKFTDYNSQGLSVYNKRKKSIILYSSETDFLHEMCYLAILSAAGEFLEKKNYYRIHALSFSFKKRGVIFISPSGGGKSTLLLELLKDENIKFFSDDIAFIDRRPYLYPFPLRIGIQKEHPILSEIEEKSIYELKRRKYGKKILVDTAAFRDRISESAAAKIIISGKRWHSPEFKFNRMNRLNIFLELCKSFVVGVGLPQVVEYMNMSFRLKNVPGIFDKIIRRGGTAMRLLLRCRSYRAYLGFDCEANRKGIMGLLESIDGG